MTSELQTPPKGFERSLLICKSNGLTPWLKSPPWLSAHTECSMKLHPGWISCPPPSPKLPKYHTHKLLPTASHKGPLHAFAQPSAPTWSAPPVPVCLAVHMMLHDQFKQQFLCEVSLTSRQKEIPSAYCDMALSVATKKKTSDPVDVLVSSSSLGEGPKSSLTKPSHCRNPK